MVLGARAQGALSLLLKCTSLLTMSPTNIMLTSSSLVLLPWVLITTKINLQYYWREAVRGTSESMGTRESAPASAGRQRALPGCDVVADPPGDRRS